MINKNRWLVNKCKSLLLFQVFQSMAVILFNEKLFVILTVSSVYNKKIMTRGNNSWESSVEEGGGEIGCL